MSNDHSSTPAALTAGQSPDHGQPVVIGSGGGFGERRPPLGIVPRKCPKCGAQTRDPFRGTIVIHDIFRCAGPSLPNTEVRHARAEDSAAPSVRATPANP